MTDADRLVHLWSLSDTELTTTQRIDIKVLTKAVVARGVTRVAIKHSWKLTKFDLDDIVSEVCLTFLKRARVYADRGEPARGGILLLVVNDVVQRYLAQYIQAQEHEVPLDSSHAQLEPHVPATADRLVELADGLCKNRELGERGIARMVAKMNRPDQPIEQFAAELLKATTEWDLIESDPVEVVMSACKRIYHWKSDQANLVKRRALGRPEVRAMLQRFTSLRGY